MLAVERRRRIAAEVSARGNATVSHLTDLLGVSAMTVRRDIDVLADQGVLRKVHGGVTAPGAPASADGAFRSRVEQMGVEKRAIARRAAELVTPGMAVGLAGGTTTWELAHFLRQVEDITVVTNSLRIAALFERPQRADEPYTQTVVLTGGVRTPSDALVGSVAVRALEHLHCDLVFLSPYGLDAGAGITTTNMLEAETDRAFIAAGRTSVVLADHSKWGAIGLTTIVDLSEVDMLITDERMPEDAREVIEREFSNVWFANVDAE